MGEFVRSMMYCGPPSMPVDSVTRVNSPPPPVNPPSLVNRPPLVKKCEAGDKLQGLVLLQAFDGSWDNNAELSTVLQCLLSDLVPPAGVDGKVWATALALAFLRLHLGTRIEEWELMGNKALVFLR